MKCSDVYYFFNQISSRTITAQVAPADLEMLQTGGYIQSLTKDDYGKLTAEIGQIEQLSSDIAQRKQKEQQQREAFEPDFREAHSIFFRLAHGREKEEAEMQKVQQEEDALKKMDSDISGEESMLASYINRKSLLDKLVPYGDAHVALTEQGLASMKDLGIRMYRVSDTDFSSYVQQMNQTLSELGGIADRGRDHFRFLTQALTDVGASEMWSTAIGLSKMQGDPKALDARFIQAFDGIEKMSHNMENRLSASEVLACSGADLTGTIPELFELDHEVRHRLGVPKELSAGVSSILFFGKRYDGTFPLDTFRNFRQLTNSYESAALMSIVNSSPDDLTKKFMAMRALFNSWGFEVSEDTELSAAYLAVSDLPADGFQSKLAIVTEGLKHYLEYPLVAAAILTSIPVMEANETLNLLEKTYSIIGARATGLEQSELIALAVRMIHGIKNELVRDLDSTARITETPVQFTYAASRPFVPLYMPMMIVHSSYYSTFSGIGGAHPGHVHALGGFVG